MTKPREPSPVRTIGHSTRPLDEFVELLQSAGVLHLVDVRSIPRSRTNPQYNLDTLPDALGHFQIGHTIIPELGGRRGRQHEVDPEVNAYWRNQSFHNYADYALSAEFRAGLDEAIRISSNDARGAPGADESTKSATLLPMLGIGLFLMIISIIVVVFVFR